MHLCYKKVQNGDTISQSYSDYRNPLHISVKTESVSTHLVLQVVKYHSATKEHNMPA